MNQNIPSTYTFIAEYRGGTYCSQVQAENIKNALVSWIEILKRDQKEIKYLGSKIIEELSIAVERDEDLPVLLKGLKNVWFSCYNTKKGIFFVNIVKTESD